MKAGEKSISLQKTALHIAVSELGAMVTEPSNMSPDRTEEENQRPLQILSTLKGDSLALATTSIREVISSNVRISLFFSPQWKSYGSTKKD
jgi:hypothetical protein